MCSDSENALSVFPDKMLYVNTGLSRSEALHCSTTVPTIVSCFKLRLNGCGRNPGPLSFMFVMVINTSVLADLAGVPVHDARIDVTHNRN